MRGTGSSKCDFGSWRCCTWGFTEPLVTPPHAGCEASGSREQEKAPSKEKVDKLGWGAGLTVKDLRGKPAASFNQLGQVSLGWEWTA
jgi:hypothetical protein